MRKPLTLLLSFTLAFAPLALTACDSNTDGGGPGQHDTKTGESGGGAGGGVSGGQNDKGTPSEKGEMGTANSDVSGANSGK